MPSALPDAKCYGEGAPKSPSDITKALADAFASAQAATAKLGSGVTQAAQPVSMQSAGTDAAQSIASTASDAAASVTSAAASGPVEAATSGGADAAAAGAQVSPLGPVQAVVPPKQGNDALWQYLEER